MNRPRIIDGDGHIQEDIAAISRHLPPEYRRMAETSGGALGIFPPLDLHETYTSKNRRFKGMALIPMQDPEAAAQELRRAGGRRRTLHLLVGLSPRSDQ